MKNLSDPMNFEVFELGRDEVKSSLWRITKVNRDKHRRQFILVPANYFDHNPSDEEIQEILDELQTNSQPETLKVESSIAPGFCGVAQSRGRCSFIINHIAQCKSGLYIGLPPFMGYKWRGDLQYLLEIRE